MIHHLLEENAALRQSGASFGRLAERLNVQLEEERRQARERPVNRRQNDDRRLETPDTRQEKLTR